MFQKKNKGFTLIELLVVVAIIGLLSSLVLASLNTARTKARDARRISDLKQVQAALELYFDTCKQYPATLVTSASNGCPATTPLTTMATFLVVIPVDPLNSGTNIYNYNAGASPYLSYCLTANMEGTPPLGAAACPTGTTEGSGADYRVTL